jgi:LPS-assembly lipoprotein
MNTLTKYSVSSNPLRNISMRNYKGLSRVLIILLMSMSLSSCGFHLRGNIPLPEIIKNMFVKAPEGTFKDGIEDVLTNAGAELATTQEGADVILVVMTADTRRDVGTLDERGLANSYDLTFTVRYQMVDQGGEVVRETKTVRERRRFDFDPNLVVETESEERELQEDMEQDVALKIVRQLSTMTRLQPVGSAAPDTEEADLEVEVEAESKS